MASGPCFNNTAKRCQNPDGVEAVLPLVGRADLEQKIAALDFANVRVRLARDGWSVEKLTQAEAEYRRFLFLCGVQCLSSVVPSEDVDDFWHAHILDTQAYARDCELLFGRFMHHDPNIGLDQAGTVLLDAAWQATCEAYFKYFGEQMPGSSAVCRKKCRDTLAALN